MGERAIEYQRGLTSDDHMKHSVFTAILLCGVATASYADCYADYKAKRDDPLRLHYGVAEVRGECNARAAQRELDDRLRQEGWQLLNVMGIFDDAGLDERRDSAGDFFLRY